MLRYDFRVWKYYRATNNKLIVPVLLLTLLLRADDEDNWEMAGRRKRRVNNVRGNRHTRLVKSSETIDKTLLARLRFLCCVFAESLIAYVSCKSWSLFIASSSCRDSPRWSKFRKVFRKVTEQERKFGFSRITFWTFSNCRQITIPIQSRRLSKALAERSFVIVNSLFKQNFNIYRSTVSTEFLT